jgi:hypothetical protein
MRELRSYTRCAEMARLTLGIMCWINGRDGWSSWRSWRVQGSALPGTSFKAPAWACNDSKARCTCHDLRHILCSLGDFDRGEEYAMLFFVFDAEQKRLELDENSLNRRGRSANERRHASPLVDCLGTPGLISLQADCGRRRPTGGKSYLPFQRSDSLQSGRLLSPDRISHVTFVLSWQQRDCLGFPFSLVNTGAKEGADRPITKYPIFHQCSYCRHNSCKLSR